MPAPVVPPVKKGNFLCVRIFLILLRWCVTYNNYLIFLEKSATQGKKRSLESDNDDNKTSSPPRVSTIKKWSV